jgi:copper chaperone
MCGTSTRKSLPLIQSGCACRSPRDDTRPDSAACREPGHVAAEFLVAGMTCGHCVSSVAAELGKLDGVSEVNVSLVPGGNSRVSVRGTRAVARDRAAAAVRDAGYELAGSD